MKALQITISGSYRNSKREVFDFENVTGVIPVVDHDLAAMHVRGRYALPWVKGATDPKTGDKLYPERIEDMRQVFIDDIKEIELKEPMSFMGKDIKEMTFEECQDLATFKDLRTIPLPKELSGVSLREMRVMAYAAYSDAFHGTNLNKDKDQEGFNYASLPALVVEGASRRDPTIKLTNEEVLAQEEKKMDIASTAKSNMTIDELRKTAKAKNIAFTPTMGFDDLYNKIYGAA
jgi:hypothetical protein